MSLAGPQPLSVGFSMVTPPLRSAVPKVDDLHGRIVHNYSHQFDGLSLSKVLEDNSVSYICFRDHADMLSQVTWYFKIDLKNGYRQVPVSPSD